MPVTALGPRSEVRLKNRSVWGLLPVKGIFRQVTGNGTVAAAGDVTGTITVAARSVHTKNKRRDEHFPGRNVVRQILAYRRAERWRRWMRKSIMSGVRPPAV